jgi:hypothetical protein
VTIRWQFGKFVNNIQKFYPIFSETVDGQIRHYLIKRIESDNGDESYQVCNDIQRYNQLCSLVI